MDHSALAIGDTTFTYARKLDGIAAEVALDGLYLIRTSVPATQMDGKRRAEAALTPDAAQIS